MGTSATEGSQRNTSNNTTRGLYRKEPAKTTLTTVAQIEEQVTKNEGVVKGEENKKPTEVSGAQLGLEEYLSQYQNFSGPNTKPATGTSGTTAAATAPPTTTA